MTPAETLLIVAGLMKNYLNQTKKFTAAEIAEMSNQWHFLLSDIPAPLVKAAALQVACTSTFFPSGGEIRKQVMNIIALAEGLPTSNDAWQEVSIKLGKGFYDNLFPDDPKSKCYKKRNPMAADWTHPLIQQAIDGIGGWRQLTHKTSIPGVDRANFIKCYDTLIARHRQDRSLLPGVKQVIAQLRGGAGNILSTTEIAGLLGD